MVGLMPAAHLRAEPLSLVGRFELAWNRLIPRSHNVVSALIQSGENSQHSKKSRLVTSVVAAEERRATLAAKQLAALASRDCVGRRSEASGRVLDRQALPTRYVPNDSTNSRAYWLTGTLG